MLGVPRSRINQIVLGRRSIEADTALRLARFFGTSDRYWLNLQAGYDLEVARDELADALAEVQPGGKGTGNSPAHTRGGPRRRRWPASGARGRRAKRHTMLTRRHMMRMVSSNTHVMTVSRNGQVSIPAATRARWKTRRVLVVDLGDRVVMRPSSEQPVADLDGKYRGRGPNTDRARRQARAEDAARARSR